MSGSLPFRWLRALALALRRWMGGVGAGRDNLSRHDVNLSEQVHFTVCLPPLPPEQQDDLPQVRNELLNARARVLSGTPFRSLVGVAELGATIHAQLEDGLKRPGVITIGPSTSVDSHRIRIVAGPLLRAGLEAITSAETVRPDFQRDQSPKSANHQDR